MISETRVSPGANQTSGGTKGGMYFVKGSFGLAGYLNDTTDWGATGGGGYYGGTSTNCHGAAGGGSSFISGYEGCDAIYDNSTKDNIIHSHQPIHYSQFVFFNTIMKGGNEMMPLPLVTQDIGHEGNGAAKITPLFTRIENQTCMKKMNNMPLIII